MRLAFALPVLSTSALALAVALRKLDGPSLSNEQEQKLQRLLKRYREQLLPSAERLAELEAAFAAQMREGLAKTVEVDGKHMMMLPTFVTRLPDGTETGECYALDLGGTNFRVMYVRLGADKGEVAACDVEEVSLPPEVYTGPGDQLFDFLARTLVAFVDRHRQQSQSQSGQSHAPAQSPEVQQQQQQPLQQQQQQLPVVGFCFSFAVEQTGLASGRLLDWTKGFTCEGVVGNDPVALLSAALVRAGRPCRVAALLNDTVGVLAAQRYLDSDTEIGVIIGTGTNACYVERLGALTKWRPPAAPPAAAGASGGGSGGRTAINMEWGAFFSPALPRCLEDLAVDAGSANPGKYLFEKLLSGMFLGEAARRILLSLAKEVPGLFPAAPAAAAAAGAEGAGTAGVSIPGRLATPGSLSSASLAAIVEDRSWKLWATRRRLARELGVHAPGLRAAAVAQEVCTLVARRAAQLTSMALLAVLRHNGWADASPPRPVTIAFDGGVYERFAAYRTMLGEAVSEQLERGFGAERREELRPLIRFALSHDGSALGAAVLAAAAVAAEP